MHIFHFIVCIEDVRFKDKEIGKFWSIERYWGRGPLGQERAHTACQQPTGVEVSGKAQGREGEERKRTGILVTQHDYSIELIDFWSWAVGAVQDYPIFVMAPIFPQVPPPLSPSPLMALFEKCCCTSFS